MGVDGEKVGGKVWWKRKKVERRVSERGAGRIKVSWDNDRRGKLW